MVSGSVAAFAVPATLGSRRSRSPCSRPTPGPARRIFVPERPDEVGHRQMVPGVRKTAPDLFAVDRDQPATRRAHEHFSQIHEAPLEGILTRDAVWQIHERLKPLPFGVAEVRPRPTNCRRSK